MTNLIVDSWTYGAEHELGDWDQRKGLPEGFKMDRRDVTCMNSNGVAADPLGKSWPFGGEINTPPTATPGGQVECLRQIRQMHPNATVNHRSNLHIHVRVPGLKDDLDMLKVLLDYVARNKDVLDLVEPIPRPTSSEYPAVTDFNAAMRRYRRRRVSHHTTLVGKRVDAMLRAKTVEEFFREEVPKKSDGTPLWHLQPRAAINIRQLLETDTIEFRHFPGTLDYEELLTCVEWCRDYLQAALIWSLPAVELYRGYYEHRPFPKFPHFDPQLEMVYRDTCHDGTLSREEIYGNIFYHTDCHYLGGTVRNMVTEVTS